MPSKVPPFSVRLGPDRQTRLTALATTAGKSANALVIEAVDALLALHEKQHPKEILAIAEANAAHLGVAKPRSASRRWSM